MAKLPRATGLLDSVSDCVAGEFEAMSRKWTRIGLISAMIACSPLAAPASELDPYWANATIYFLMTDRFANGDPTNDSVYGRVPDGDPQRSFQGGDLAGVNQKLREGYFKNLGVSAIWTTPLVEQVRLPFQEYGRSYAFHGYWPKDWTTIDKSFGTEQQFAEMVRLAHSQDIRVIVDVIMNHAGPPIGGDDPAWPEQWVRTEPTCDYKTMATTISCRIVPALQDIRTDRDAETELPEFLKDKWKREGRYETEIAELDAYFDRTGHPRTPRYYLIKWLTDWVREYGVDGFRVDTAKHVEPSAWQDLKTEASQAYEDWKALHPGALTEDRDFYMVGELFNFGMSGFERSVGRSYDYGDQKVDFFAYGFDAMINMGFPTHAREPAPALFARYASQFAGPFKGVGMLNYISSHDDGAPLDPLRESGFSDAFKLMLAPGAVQIYYGDELNRLLVAEGATGDAKLRSSIDWSVLDTTQGKLILNHWQRLGQFRARHVAVGAGQHIELSRTPYVFSRSYDHARQSDHIVAAYSEHASFKEVPSGDVFSGVTSVHDTYNNDTCWIRQSFIVCPTERNVALFELAESDL